MTSSDRVRALGEPLPGERERITTATFAGGASFEAMCGAVALVLAIIGLAGIAMRYMPGLALLAIGCGVFVAGGAIAARWQREVAGFVGEPGTFELAAGVGSEVVGGVIGIVLSIIGLAGYAPRVMLPIAAIVYGASLVLGAAVRMRAAELVHDTDARFERETGIAIETATVTTIVAALASIVLGVLGLVGIAPLVLALVASLALAAALLLAGTAETARYAHRLAELR